MKKFFYLFFIIWGSVVLRSTICAKPVTDHIRDTYLHITPMEVTRLAEAESRGLMEIKTVILPEGINLWGSNKHLGWPTAVMADDVIIVLARRMIYHYGCPPACPYDSPKSDSDSGVFVVRSIDPLGQSWGPMQDLQPLLNIGVAGPGGMDTIGVNSSGEVIAINKRGMVCSTDKGRTWTIYPHAFSDISSPNINIGPNLVNHPYFGMLIFNGAYSDSTPEFEFYASAYPGPPYPIFIRRSLDGGYTWSEMAWYDYYSEPQEPAAVEWDGNILMISREYNPDICNDGKTSNMSQHLYRYQSGDVFEDINFESKRTNIIGNIHSGISAHDTGEIIYNPVTKRLEMLDSHRFGGGPGYDGHGMEVARSSLNLWSIDPNDILAGSAAWRFEGTLMIRDNHCGGCDNFVDGLHPGSSVVDENRGLQHIFIYAGGEGCTEQGIFQITRTLHTPSLSRFLKSSVPNHFYKKYWEFENINLTNDLNNVFLTVELDPEIVDYGQFSSNGSDIYFTDLSNYMIPHRILRWDPSGTSVILVKIPVLKAGCATDDISMYWGDNSAKFYEYDDEVQPKSESFSVSFWMKNKTVGTLYYAVNKGNDTSSSEPGWSFLRDSGNTFHFRLQGNYTVSCSNFTDITTWHHIVGIVDRNDNIMRLYIDGVLQGTNNIIGLSSIISDERLKIANTSNAEIDDILITKEILSLEQVQLLHLAGRNGSIIKHLRNEQISDVVLTVNAITDTVSESEIDSAAYIIQRSGDTLEPLEVDFFMGGTAENGIDCLKLTGPAIIPANQAYVTIPLSPIWDSKIEEDESAVLVLLPGKDYDLEEMFSACITITDKKSCEQIRAENKTQKSDLNRDCFLDLHDLIIFTEKWLYDNDPLL